MNKSSVFTTPTPDSAGLASLELSGFSINLDAFDVCGSSTGHPIGMKIAKLKRRKEEQLKE